MIGPGGVRSRVIGPYGIRSRGIEPCGIRSGRVKSYHETELEKTSSGVISSNLFFIDFDLFSPW